MGFGRSSYSATPGSGGGGSGGKLGGLFAKLNLQKPAAEPAQQAQPAQAAAPMQTINQPAGGNWWDSPNMMGGMGRGGFGGIRSWIDRESALGNANSTGQEQIAGGAMQGGNGNYLSGMMGQGMGGKGGKFGGKSRSPFMSSPMSFSNTGYGMQGDGWYNPGQNSWSGNQFGFGGY